MATIDTIRQSIQNIAPSLSNTSTSALWNRIASVFAAVIDTTTLNMSNSEEVIRNTALNLRVAGEQYYVDKALAFQEGDSLVIVDPSTYRYGYATIDESKQIIKQVTVSAVPSSATVNVNAAKQDSDGYNVALSETEAASLQNYLQRLAPLGISVKVAKIDAVSEVTAQRLFVRYYKSYSLPVIQQAVKSALISTQGMLVGGDPIYVNDLESALKAIDGVRDAWFNNLTYDGSRQPTNGIITPKSGFFNFSDALTELSIVQFDAI